MERPRLLRSGCWTGSLHCLAYQRAKECQRGGPGSLDSRCIVDCHFGVLCYTRYNDSIGVPVLLIWTSPVHL